MKSITYSAPAKVILSGEHSVVYGKPGLVCALDLRIRVHILSSKVKPIADPIFKTIDAKVRHFIGKQSEPIHDEPYEYRITSHIPVGRGLGSSAALSAAASAALLEFYTGKEWSQERINQCAYEVEKIFHQNPSGVDVSASVFGGLIWYRKEFEFLKTISSLSMNIPHTIMDGLYLIDTGKPQESTADMVRAVGKRYNRYPKKMESALQAIERVTKRMVVSLAKEDPQLFQASLKENQELLETLGIVSVKTRKLISNLSQHATGKVTGAGGKNGGSGFALFYAAEPTDFLTACKKMKLDVIQFTPTYKGIQKEEIL
jgi:mevalonate kinase